MTTTEQILDDTLTRQQYDRLRNGNGPEASVERVCGACGKPLTSRQQRACGNECAGRLGRGAKGFLAMSAYLASLPPDVDAIELLGWRCVRMDGHDRLG